MTKTLTLGFIRKYYRLFNRKPDVWVSVKQVRRRVKLSDGTIKIYRPRVDKDGKSFEEYKAGLVSRIKDKREEAETRSRKNPVVVHHVEQGHRHLLATVNVRVRYRKRSSVWYKIEDISLDDVYRRMDKLPGQDLMDSEVKHLKEAAIEKLMEDNEEREIDSELFWMIAEAPSLDDIMITNFVRRPERPDMTRVPMRDINFIVPFDGDKIKKLMSDDETYHEIVEQYGKEACANWCVPMYCMYIVKNGYKDGNGNRPSNLMTLEDVKRMLVTCDGEDLYDNDKTCFHQPDDIRDDEKTWEDVVRRKDVEGYTARDMVNFCIELGVNIILYESNLETELPLVYHRCEGDTPYQTIVGVVRNNHLFIPVDPSFKASAVAKVFAKSEARGGGGKGRKMNNSSKVKEGEGNEVEVVIKIQVDDRNAMEVSWNTFVESVNKYGIPESKTIRYDHAGGLKSWHFKDSHVLYVVDTDPDLAEKSFNALFNDDITKNKMKPWRNQSLPSIVRAFYNGVFCENLPPYGTPTPSVFRAFTAPFAKDGVLRGYACEVSQEFTERFKESLIGIRRDMTEYIESDTLTFDMRRAYATLMCDPLDDWMRPTFVDEVKMWSGEWDYHNLPSNTMYLVRIDITRGCPIDTVHLLFNYFQKRRGWYDRVRILFAVNELGLGAHMHIEAYVTFSATISKTHYLDAFKEVGRRLKAVGTLDDDEISRFIKTFGQVLSGAILGSDDTKMGKFFFTSNMLEMEKFFFDEEIRCGRKVSLVNTHGGRVECPSSKGVHGLRLVPGAEPYLFARSVAKEAKTTTNIAQYMQLTNWMSVRVFQIKVHCEKHLHNYLNRLVMINTDGVTFELKPQYCGSKDKKKKLIKKLGNLPNFGMPARIMNDPEIPEVVKKFGTVDADKDVCKLYDARDIDERCVPPLTPHTFDVAQDVNDSSHFASIIDNIVFCGDRTFNRSFQGFRLSGGPGTGKTFVLRKVCEAIESSGYRVAYTALTHRAKSLFGVDKDVMTLHRMLGWGRKDNESGEFVADEERQNAGTRNDKLVRIAKMYDVIVVDELSMVPPDILGALLAIKRIKPKMVFIMSGDGRQLPPVVGGDSQYNITHQLDSSIVHELTGGLAIQLTVDHRIDAKLKAFGEEMYDGTYEHTLRNEVHRAHTIEELPDLTLTHSNAVANAINAMKMESRMDDVVIKIKCDDGNQELGLGIGHPIACILTGEGQQGHDVQEDDVQEDEDEIVVVEKWWYNQERLTIVAIDLEEKTVDIDGFRVQQKFGDPEPFSITDVSFDELSQYFVPGYAMTTHKVQGSTLDEDYAIVEVNNSPRWREGRFTAVTRARRFDQLWTGSETLMTAIMDRAKEFQKRRELCAMAKKKISGYRAQDKKHNNEWNWATMIPKEDRLTAEFLMDALERCDQTCDLCHRRMSVTASGEKQWTWDRERNNEPHKRSNGRIRCLSCNSARTQRYLNM